MISRKLFLGLGLSTTIGVAVTGCSVNPVTGEQELSLMSPAQEIAIGERQYPLNQQQQGGAYSLDPGLQRYVSSVGKKLARVSDNPTLPYEFVVLNNSEANAWALPGGKIAINRGLLMRLDDEAELAAVLAHEIVHSAARHSAQAMSRQQVLGVGIAVLGATTQDSEWGDIASQAGALGGAAYIARYGRSNELQSDEVGMRYMSKAGYDPQGAVRVQEKFLALSRGRESNAFEALFASHPPSAARVEANKRHATQLPAGGTTNRDAFQSAMRQLNRGRGAYLAYDDARRAAGKKDWDLALKYLQRAQQMQPREGAFFALEGDIQFARNDYQSALAAYNRAVSENPQLFSNWLARGMTRTRLGQYSAAEKDLTRSLGLLQTAAAYLFLGETMEARGDRNGALRNYQMAAQDPGNVGKQARARMQQLAGG
ncbi:M48 family metalloprotease [Biformimicrobium ophioploci]|uniref:M48 family metallopeptidase n=1 Tax=Biformimicrobium ophioploci TaxID=3036711 RepID=A0ABQ6LVL8_9GAMM|nr:M48 family metalloprotease [Microbulbifer sp. NKW57]GMG86092.1 M48 family metallopeptidase [Microbulbifer sp. NKW57]